MESHNPPQTNGDNYNQKISLKALAILIQILDEKICILEDQRKQMNENDQNLMDVEEELRDYSLVEEELRVAYEEASRNVGNFPPYEELISREVEQAVVKNQPRKKLNDEPFGEDLAKLVADRLVNCPMMWRHKMEAGRGLERRPDGSFVYGDVADSEIYHPILEFKNREEFVGWL